MSKLHGRSYKNQVFVLFAIECDWKLILEGFWVWDGGIFASRLAFRSVFESNAYEICFFEGVGVRRSELAPSPPLKLKDFGRQWEGSGRASHAETPLRGRRIGPPWADDREFQLG